MFENLRAGKFVQEGGSTITQQLAKNLLFTKRVSSEIFEALAAFSLERRLSKGTHPRTLPQPPHLRTRRRRGTAWI